MNIAQVALLDKNLGGTTAAYDASNFPTTAMTATGTAAAGAVTGTLGWNDTTKVFTITDDLGVASDISETTLDTTFDGKAATLTYTAGDDTTTPVTLQNFKIEYEAGGVLDTVDTATVGTYTDSNGATTTSADTGTGVSIMTMNISALTDSAEDMAMLNAFTQQVDTTIANMTTAASDVGAVKSRIGLQQSFVTSLKNSIDMGVGSLVDADMNQESTETPGAASAAAAWHSVAVDCQPERAGDPEAVWLRVLANSEPSKLAAARQPPRALCFPSRSRAMIWRDRLLLKLSCLKRSYGAIGLEAVP